MLIIEGGRSCLYQWDIDQRLEVVNPDVHEVHFSSATISPALVCDVYEEDGRRFANIPNILLQEAWAIQAHGCCDSRVRDVLVCRVVRRARPADYVYTETEVKTFDALEKRIKHIEENGGGKPGERGYGITDISTQAGVSGTKVTIEYESEDGPQTKTFNVSNGASPRVSMTPTAEGYRLTVSDGFGSIQSVEIKHGKDGVIAQEDVAKAVEAYLADHPVEGSSVTINGEGPDENGNFVVNTINDVEVAQLFAALT